MVANANAKADEELLSSCPACGCKASRLFVHSNGRNVVRCKQCDLLYVNPRPSEQAIRRHFVEEYIDTDDRVTDDFTSWRQASLRREAGRLKRLCTKGGRLLDLGTASGAFLGEFSQDRAWQVEGVEPSRFAAKAASERYQVPVHTGFLRDLKLPPPSFDAIVSLDPFYFHPDPRSDLEEIVRVLRPGGLLALEIPGLRFRLLKNAGLLCRMIYGVPARLNAGVHLFYYSRKTLGQLVRQFGFEEEAVYPEQSPLYGRWYARIGNWLYYGLTSALYRITGGRWSLVPKEFIVYRKAGT